MDVLRLVVLTLTGLTSWAEFGFYAFVHPAVRRLPAARMIAYEQRMLRTLERTYPVLMPLTGVLLVVYAAGGGGEGAAVLWRWMAVAAWAGATVITLIGGERPDQLRHTKMESGEPAGRVAGTLAAVGCVSGGARLAAACRIPHHGRRFGPQLIRVDPAAPVNRVSKGTRLLGPTWSKHHHFCEFIVDRV